MKAALAWLADKALLILGLAAAVAAVAFATAPGRTAKKIQESSAKLRDRRKAIRDERDAELQFLDVRADQTIAAIKAEQVARLAKLDHNTDKEKDVSHAEIAEKYRALRRKGPDAARAYLDELARRP